MILRKTLILTLVFTIFGLMLLACTGSADMAGSDALTCEKVRGAGTGTASLSWSAPTENSDNSLIPTNGDYALAGYVIHFGPTTGSMVCSINISDPVTTSYDVTDLLTGTEYAFAVTAYNNLGAESDLSNIVIRSSN